MKKLLVILVCIVFTGAGYAKTVNTCIKHFPNTAYTKRYGHTVSYYDKNDNKLGSIRIGTNGSIASYDEKGQKTGVCKKPVRKRTPYKRTGKMINTYDRYGFKTGSYKRYGNRTTYYDKDGNKLGSYKVNINGTVTHYDKNGSKTGSY